MKLQGERGGSEEARSETASQTETGVSVIADCRVGCSCNLLKNIAPEF